MSPNIVFVVTIAALFTVGVYLVLERSLTRILLGIILLGNGTNLLILVAGGAAGSPPLIGVASDRPMSDPLPQALILTAIVITLGLTAFLLAMAYRSWQLHRHDEVQDDVEDRRIAYLAARDEMAFSDSDTDTEGPHIEDEAREVRDETDSLLLLVGEEGLVDEPVAAARPETPEDADGAVADDAPRADDEEEGR